MSAPAHRASLLPRLALAWLVLCALGMAVWPVYRVGVPASIDPNEGWNAYLADAALGKMPLYPGPDRLVTNNYPPLSFYAVGLLGRLVGDNVLAGRLLSLAAVAAIGWAVARMVATLGGNGFGATAAAAWFVGTMCRYFTGYVGMDDPQLLAQALMALAFACFLQTASQGKSCAPAILVMVAAGFFKHNIVAMPAAAMAWLFFRRRDEFWHCVLVAGAAMTAGFAACYALYGAPFIFNFCTPRSHDWNEALLALKDAGFVAAGVAAWVALPWTGSREARIVSWWAGIGLVAFFLQKSGAGVDMNAQFDWVIALSVAVGLGVSRLASLLPERSGKLVLAQTAALLLLWAGWWMTPQVETFRLLFDPAFREEIAASKLAMAEAVAQARNSPMDVDSSDPLVCYWAGKPFVVDEFNAWERIQAGKLPPDAVSRLVKAGKLIQIDLRQGCP